MKKIAVVLSLVALMGLSAGTALAGPVYINGMPLLSDQEWAARYNQAPSVASGSIPTADQIVTGATAGKMAASYQGGTAVRPVQEFGPLGTCLQSPLTDEQWTRQYNGGVGSAY